MALKDLPVSGGRASRSGRASALALACLVLPALAAPAAAGDAAVTFENEGIGVLGTVPSSVPVPRQINHDPQTGATEALAIDFGAELAEAVVVVARLFPDEQGLGECGRWIAYGADGARVGEGLMHQDLPAGTIDYDGPDTGSITIGDATNPVPRFRYLVLTALPYGCDASPPPTLDDSSDYFVQRVDFTFEADGSTGSAGGTPASAANWSSVELDAFDFGTDFEDASGRFVGAPFVVGDAACSGQGQNNTECVIPLTPQCTTTVSGGDVEGTIEVAGIIEVIDFRAVCGFDGNDPVQTLPGAVQPVAETADGSLDLGFALTPPGFAPPATGPLVPRHLCGVPDPAPAAQGRFTIVDIDAALAVSRSVIEHEIEDLTAGFGCASGEEVLAAPDPRERRSRLTVVGWLPKTSASEIPVLDALGLLEPTLQDVTTGCGSVRAGTRKLSFLAYNLRHALETDYRGVTRDAIAQLAVTVDQTGDCIQRGHALALKVRVALIANAFERGRYALAKLQLINLLRVVQTSRLDRQFAQCFYDLESFPGAVTGPDPSDPDLIARNFRGDLIVQVRHVLYMLERTLGVIQPRVPAGL